jgi:hypothetical protein
MALVGNDLYVANTDGDALLLRRRDAHRHAGEARRPAGGERNHHWTKT